MKVKNFFKAIVTVSLCAMMVFAFSGCSQSGSATHDVEATKTVRFGIKADFSGILDSVTPKIEALGYKVERTIFDDFVQPNVALSQDAIDITWTHHEPYITAYNQSNGTNLVMLNPKPIYNVFGFYSTKWKSIDEIPNGATICICNDASNKLRGLKLLQSNGLIKLQDGIEFPTQYDIVDNPKNLQFIEAEISMVPKSIDDCDGVAVAGLQVLNAGMDPQSYLFCSDDEDNKEFAIGLVVDGRNADAKWAQEIVDAVQCDELVEFLEKNKKGAQLPAWL